MTHSQSKKLTKTEPKLQAKRKMPKPLIDSGLLRRVQTISYAASAVDMRMLQRAVGNTAANRFVIQPKMNVGPAGDKYEREADRVSAEVVQHIASGNIQRNAEDDEIQLKPVVHHVQRVDDEEIQLKVNHGLEGGEVDHDVAQQIQNAKGGGAPLDKGVRSQMEGAFGTNFDGVRIHADQKADQLNRSLNARAFTTGGDIFFRKGAFEPSSTAGKSLLAHELTHVVQQGASAPLQRRPIIQRDDSRDDDLAIGGHRGTPATPDAATIAQSDTQGSSWTSATPTALQNQAPAHEDVKWGGITKKKRRFGPNMAAAGPAVGTVGAGKALFMQAMKVAGHDLPEMAKSLMTSLATKAAEQIMSGEVIAKVKEIIGMIGSVTSIVGDILPIVGGAVKTLTSIITMGTNVAAIYQRRKHFNALKPLKESDNQELAAAADYGRRKVFRSLIEKIYQGVESVGQFLIGIADIGVDIAAVLSLGAAELAKIVTLGASTASMLINLGKAGVRSIKGIVKAARGTRAVNRFKHATSIMDAAQDGDEDARELITKFGLYSFSAQLSREIKLGTKHLIADLKNFGAKISEKPRDKLGSMTDKVKAKIGFGKDDENTVQGAPAGDKEEMAMDAFKTWGINNIERFIDWVKDNYSLTPMGVAELILHVIREWNPIAFLNFKGKKDRKERKLKRLNEEFEHYANDETWRKLMITTIANRLKSN